MTNLDFKTRAKIKENQKKILALKAQEKEILAPKKESLLKVFNLLKTNSRLISLQRSSVKKIENKKVFNSLKVKKRSLLLEKSFLKFIKDKKGLESPNFLKALKKPKTKRREAKGDRRKHLDPTKTLHASKKKPQRFGLLRIKFAKRNIYLNLSDSKNRLKLTITTGYIKVKGAKLKGKARRAVYILKQFARRFSLLVRATKINRVHLVISGYVPRKLKRIFLKTFKRILVKKFKKKRKRWPRKKTKKVLKEIKAYKKAQRRAKAKLFRFYRYTRHLRHPHNGCRPRKVRRR